MKYDLDKLNEQIDGTRVFTVMKWHREQEVGLREWPQELTDAIEGLAQEQFKKKRIYKLNINISKFRCEHCPGIYSDIEIHDRALCATLLAFFEVEAIHSLLEMVTFEEGNISPQSRFTVLLEQFQRHVTAPIRRSLKYYNKATLTEIENDGGKQNGEYKHYKHKLHQQARKIRKMIYRLIKDYWYQYYVKRSLGSMMKDYFEYVYKDVYCIIKMVQVPRYEQEAILLQGS